MTASYGTSTTAITGNTGYPEGYSVGTSATDDVGFYGVTPIVQPSGAAQAAVTTTAPTVTAYGFTQAQATALLTLTNEMRRVLVALGLMKGSA